MGEEMKFAAKFLRKATQQLLLYHGSQKKFPIGFTLLPQSDGYAASQNEDIANTEQILEAHRPPHCLPRSKSVFLVGDPEEIDFAGGYTDFIYRVEPIGRVEKNDMDWYGQLSCVMWDEEDDPEAVRLAENYWNGTPSDHSENSLFEYRAGSAKIVELVEVE
jgi:hypothetical protein